MKKIFILVIITCATICTNKMTANALQTTTISETEEPTSNTSLSDEDLEGFTFYTNVEVAGNTTAHSRSISTELTLKMGAISGYVLVHTLLCQHHITTMMI